jgi:hypothetical protein
MDERRVEKEIRLVVVELSDGKKISGEVFLRRHEARRAGPQKIGDLLNGELAFMPMKIPGGVLMINVEQIVSVEVAMDDEMDELMTLGKRYEVVMTMADGQERGGTVYVNLPEGTSRFKDYINQPLRFFPLFHPASILYINRRYILSARD